MTKAEANTDTQLTSGRVLVRNTLWNLIGHGTPPLVAMFAIPALIHGLGTERFGVLTLAWMMIGYFGLFDLGLGRATTKLVAEKLGACEEQYIPVLVWTSLFLMLILGLVGAMAVGLLSTWLIYDALKIPEALQLEGLYAFYIIALSIPVLVSIAGLRGILEAQQRFGLVNAVRIPAGIFTFLGPWLMLPFSKSVFSLVAVLATTMLISWLAHLLLCLYTMAGLRYGMRIQLAVVTPLIRFGSWMTLTNIVGPLMTYLDRFFVGSLISMTAVAYYATPYEVVTRLGIIPGAIVGVLFPAFAATFAQDRKRTALLFDRGIKYTFLGLFPITLLIVTLAREGINLWLGAEFARNSTHVLQWLAIGVFINGLAQIPFALVQGAGRPDLTAKLHLIELPFYLVTAWWLIGEYGIEGAAIAWVVRVVVDTLFLFGMVRLFLATNVRKIGRMAFAICVALLILAIASLPMGVARKGPFLFLTLIVFVLFTWRFVIDDGDKQKISSIFGGSVTVVRR